MDYYLHYWSTPPPTTHTFKSVTDRHTQKWKGVKNWWEDIAPCAQCFADCNFALANNYKKIDYKMAWNLHQPMVWVQKWHLKWLCLGHNLWWHHKYTWKYPDFQPRPLFQFEIPCFSMVEECFDALNLPTMIVGIVFEIYWS